MLGPLAPRRDTGDNEYGTMAGRELEGAKGGLGRGVLTERSRGGITAAGKRSNKRNGVGMSWQESLIYKGDRVAIVSDTGPESREKGKIGTVTEVRKSKREVVIEDLNLVRTFTWC